MSNYVKVSLIEYLNESKVEVRKLKKQLKEEESKFFHLTYNNPVWEDKWDELEKTREELSDKVGNIRRRLFELTGDYYGETNKKTKKEPPGLHNTYDHPADVPKNVYRWLTSNSSLLYSDATDAVRWYRIINTKKDQRYPSGDITIYRAVDNKDYDDIREGDWVTTYESYARKHLENYFDGKGKIIEMTVDGKDVLVSPTGDHEEAIYAPLELSIDIRL